MKSTRDPKPVTNLLGRAYPLGDDPASKKKRLISYLLESLLIPVGVVLLEWSLEFYRSWDAETITIHGGRMALSFVVAYVLYFLLTYLATERRVKKYRAWKEQTFHSDR